MGSYKAPGLFQDRLDACRDVIRGSAMLRELREALAPYADSIDKIRCLALGSFHEDVPARYQLALLLEIESFLRDEGKKTISVSLYDPVFTADDIEYIHQRGPNYTVDQSPPNGFQDANSKQILYFLPHAPLDLTEQVLIAEQPRLLLANNIVEHTDRYTKARLHEKYPMLSKLLHVLERAATVPDSTQANAVDVDDQFKSFVSKKKRRNKKVFKEPVIDYDSVKSYFNNCSIITDFQAGALLRDQPWINSFSDLTFHHIASPPEQLT
ncbi:hypothetical protein HG536_0E02000 [Torulaspora globosa]|uniref:SRR1-like domain-containing protein n=1 Tax=Torulaspora globosa TaxID=48254 RepID=A0A7G3ZIF3_9SACH|nr:uncharacterized protein HG536_0E02000 [Torulaspora globosa]QLL33289.1 hypothetical protein HG536_0E02000 [Torulaspora globosa]